MREPIEIEREYFNWLCAKVLETDTLKYYPLVEVLYRTEYIWVIPADKHRLEDGLELRELFRVEIGLKQSNLMESQPCSIFEMLIAFADRASFQTDIPVKDWFWIFMSNLKLDHFINISELNLRLIEDILYTFTWRIYEPNGSGGLFPMTSTPNDQREIELWYQLFEWVDERELI